MGSFEHTWTRAGERACLHIVVTGTVDDDDWIAFLQRVLANHGNSAIWVLADLRAAEENVTHAGFQDMIQVYVDAGVQRFRLALLAANPTYAQLAHLFVATAQKVGLTDLQVELFETADQATAWLAEA